MRIHLERIEKEYLTGGRRLAILRGIDLTIPSRTVAAVVGPSGSGKTTLLGLMAGLDRPTAGKVYLGETEITSSTEEERAVFRARHIGFVFQTFHLLPSLTARENVQVPLELHPDRSGPSQKEIRSRAEELLDRVGLGDRVHHYPAQLSGGEKQRVALARAFATRPKILFADEPTGNLDRETGARIVGLLEELNRESRTTLVLVTHDLELAARARMRIHMESGRVRVEEAVPTARPGPARPSTPP
jgi:putative ABC transport system ATP-binding protein